VGDLFALGLQLDLYPFVQQAEGRKENAPPIPALSLANNHLQGLVLAGRQRQSTISAGWKGEGPKLGSHRLMAVACFGQSQTRGLF
jgi:hypothetical protein